MEWAALIAWVVTAGGGFVLLAIWLGRGGMRQGRIFVGQPDAVIEHAVTRRKAVRRRVF